MEVEKRAMTTTAPERCRMWPLGEALPLFANYILADHPHARESRASQIKKTVDGENVRVETEGRSEMR